MNKLIVAVLLIGLGLALIVQGSRRADSVVGVTDELGSKLANTWDGKARQPKHVWYYGGGGALVLAGIMVAVRKGRAT